jgi:hypothetical protein
VVFLGDRPPQKPPARMTSPSSIAVAPWSLSPDFSWVADHSSSRSSGWMSIDVVAGSSVSSDMAEFDQNRPPPTGTRAHLSKLSETGGKPGGFGPLAATARQETKRAHFEPRGETDTWGRPPLARRPPVARSPLSMTLSAASSLCAMSIGARMGPDGRPSSPRRTAGHSLGPWLALGALSPDRPLVS